MKSLKLFCASLALVLFAFSGCSTKTEEPKKPEATAEKKAEVKAEKPKLIKGQEEPPIAKADVPKGNWYCDMGTVHYHRAEKGDAKCPLCKMDLHEKK